MTDDTSGLTDGSLADCSHDRFERNHYFHGKLMTARDMAAEQRYHAGHRRAHARSVAGSGIAWGLETTVQDDGTDAIVVTVQPGYAIDECGRAIVVPREREKTITDGSKVNAPAVTVWIEYEACLKESVPVSGAETACEDECAYNRVLEVYDVEVKAAYPDDEDVTKPIESITFPDWDDLETVTESGRERPGDYDAGLSKIAETYRREAPAPTGAAEDARLYLGTFTPGSDDGSGSDDEWDRDEALPTPSVYTNDMLYAAVAKHTADFGNPHETSLTTVDHGDDNAAGVRIRDDASDQPEVAVSSTDESVTVDHAAAAQRIDLSVEDHVESVVEARVEPVERYAAEKALKYTALVFRRAAERFDGEAGGTAGDVADLARRAVDARLEADGQTVQIRDEDGTFGESIDAEDYESLLTEFLSLEQEFRGQVADQVTDESYARLSDAIGGLKTALEPADPGTLALGATQDDVADAVEWLEPVDDGEPEEPGEATFADGGVVEERQGDVAEIAVDLEDTTSATLEVGGEGEGYHATVDVLSGGGGSVTVLLNTYLAGRTDDEAEAFDVADPADDVTVTRHTDQLDGLLATSDYGLRLSVDDDETDAGTLMVTDRSTDSLEVLRGSPGAYDALNSPSAVIADRDDGTLTTAGEVDPGDTVVADVAVSGVFGAIASESGDPWVADPGTIQALEADQVLSLGVAQTGAVVNEPKQLDLQRSVADDAARLFAHPDEKRLFLVVDSGEATLESGDATGEMAAGEGYEASFGVHGDGPLADEDETVSGAFSMAGPEMVTVPNVVGDSYSQAAMELSDAGLTPNPTFVAVDDLVILQQLSFGSVGDQDPPGGSSVEVGSEVDLTVYTSRQIGDIVGLEDTYKDVLAKYGFEYVHQLEAADAAALADDIQNVSESQVQGWIDQATDYRIAHELSLQQGTSFQEALTVSGAFRESGQTDVMNLQNDEMQSIITTAANDPTSSITAESAGMFLNNSDGLTYLENQFDDDVIF